MLFKILHGDASKISLDVTPFHEGWCYVTHDGCFYVDLNIGTEETPNNQRLKLNAKDAETLMGKSLVELQSDWSVNDETSPAYVKNRPFYTTDPEAIELHNGTITFQEAAQGDTTFYIGQAEQLNEYSDFTVGQEIKIIFDEVEYNLTLKLCDIGLYAGNASIINDMYGLSEEDTGEPFYYIPGRGFITTTSETEHTIVVYVYHIEDITIPHKYLGLNIWNGGGNKSAVIGNETNVASGVSSVALGEGTTASGDNSHAEGYSTTASGYASHAEGHTTTASGSGAHAEGSNTTASNARAHAEGSSTTASGMESHAEGQGTKAQAIASHAEGIKTTASGEYASHAEGYYANATASYAHAEGLYTVAASESQHAQGKFNIEDTAAKYAHIVGNGTNTANRSNAHTLDWSGNAWFAGDVKVGGTGQDDVETKTLATTEYVDSKAVQSDWAIHDENDPAFIKNRTHWSKASQVEVLSECQPEAMDGGFKLDNTVDVVAGHTYIVNWNGTPYTCVAGTIDGIAIIGNGNQFGLDDTGEPFLMIFYPDSIASAVGYYVAIVSLDGSTTCTVSIVHHFEDIYKIDNKYLSDEALAKSDWNAAENELGHILNRTHYTEEALEEVIPEITVTFGDATEQGRDTGTATGSATQIYPEHGEMFAIEWNGTKYYSEARSYTKEDGSFGRGIGNTGMFGGGVYAQYPFLIGFLTEEEATTAGHTYLVWVNDGSTTATFSVSKVGELVHRLDAKYLPENIATEDYVDTAIAATKPKMTTITLPTANWTGDTNPWSQVVTINGVTANSKVDLQPTATQIVALQNAEITLMLQNDSGTVTAWAIGNKPTEDYTMQVLITEVTVV